MIFLYSEKSFSPQYYTILCYNPHFNNLHFSSFQNGFIEDLNNDDFNFDTSPLNFSLTSLPSLSASPVNHGTNPALGKVHCFSLFYR